MKKLMIPYVISLYLMVLSLYIGGKVSRLNGLVLLVIPLLLIVIVLGIANLFFLIFKKNELQDSIIRDTMIYKIVLIPFYIFSFILGFAFLLVGSLAGFTIFFLATIPLLFVVFLIMVFTYIAMIGTSANNIVLLVKNRDKNGIVFTIVNIILQLIFVIDLIDSIFLYIHYKKSQSQQS
ncbi:MAG: hypothetical protein ACI35W_03775 [Anaeroplasmataceae bacterium]